MPSADFCAAIRRPFDLLSRFSDTAQTSRGKTNSLPHPPPNLRSAPLVDMDFVVDRPLVRRSRLISGSCSSVHAFAPRFLQTPPRDDALALRYPFTSTRLGRGLSPPSCRSCPAHDPSTRPPGGLARDDSGRDAELGLGGPRVGGLRAGGFRSAPGSENGLQELSRRHDLEALVAGNLQKVLVSADDGLAVGREGARYELVIIPVSRNLIR